VDVSRPSVVAIVGSPRRNGNTAALVAAVLEALEARGAACETIELSRLSIAPCLAHDTCGELAACPQGDDAAEVLDRVYAADCLILGTPVYYENVSAQMKAFIDRNVFRYAHDEWLRAKAVGLVVVTAETGLEETVAALRRYVALSSDHDIPVSVCAGYADEAGAAAADDELLGDARRLAEDLAAAVGLSAA
jgi:multimeric flavodoxin WrbA